MPKLHVLILEDSEDDAILTEDALSRNGLASDVKVVSDASGFGAALTERSWDIVISDHGIPGFSALAALEMVYGGHRVQGLFLESQSRFWILDFRQRGLSCLICTISQILDVFTVPHTMP